MSKKLLAAALAAAFLATGGAAKAAEWTTAAGGATITAGTNNTGTSEIAGVLEVQGAVTNTAPAGVVNIVTGGGIEFTTTASTMTNNGTINFGVNAIAAGAVKDTIGSSSILNNGSINFSGAQTAAIAGIFNNAASGNVTIDLSTFNNNATGAGVNSLNLFTNNSGVITLGVATTGATYTGALGKANAGAGTVETGNVGTYATAQDFGTNKLVAGSANPQAVVADSVTFSDTVSAAAIDVTNATSAKFDAAVTLTGNGEAISLGGANTLEFAGTTAVTMGGASPYLKQYGTASTLKIGATAGSVALITLDKIQSEGGIIRLTATTYDYSTGTNGVIAAATADTVFETGAATTITGPLDIKSGKYLVGDSSNAADAAKVVTFNGNITGSGFGFKNTEGVADKAIFNGVVDMGTGTVEATKGKTVDFQEGSSLATNTTVAGKGGTIVLASIATGAAPFAPVFQLNKVNNTVDGTKILLSGSNGAGLETIYGALGTIGGDKKATLETGAASRVGTVDMKTGDILIGGSTTGTFTVTNASTTFIFAGDTAADKIAFAPDTVAAGGLADNTKIVGAQFNGSFTTGDLADGGGFINTKNTQFADNSTYVKGGISNEGGANLNLSSKVNNYSGLLANTLNKATANTNFTAADPVVAENVALADGSTGTLTVTNAGTAGWTNVDFNGSVDAKGGQLFINPSVPVINGTPSPNNPTMTFNNGLSSTNTADDAITFATGSRGVVASALNGNTTVDALTTFVKGADFTGENAKMTLRNGGIRVGDGTSAGAADLKFTNGQTLTMGGNHATVEKDSTLQLAAGSTFATGGGNIILNDVEAGAVLDLGIKNNGLQAATAAVRAAAAAPGAPANGYVVYTGDSTANANTALTLNTPVGGVSFQTTGNAQIGAFTSNNSDVEVDEGASIQYNGLYNAGTGKTDIEKGATAIYKAGATSAGGFEIKNGATGTYTGPVTGTVTTRTGGRFESVGAGVTLNNGMTTEDGSTIFVGVQTNGDASTIVTNGQTVDIASGTSVEMDRNVRGDATVINNLDDVVLDNGAVTDNQQIANWFGQFDLLAVNQDGNYYLDPATGQLRYGVTIKNRDDSWNSLRDVTEANGGGDSYRIANDRFAQTVYDAGAQQLVADPNNLSGFTYTSSILDAIAGHTNAQRPNGLFGREREAMLQYMTGHDLVGTLEAVQDTVRDFTRTVTNRAYNLGNLGVTQYDECGNPINTCGGTANRIWAGYSGLWGDADRRGGDAGYKYDAHGFNVGFDSTTSSGFAFGGAFGYSKGDYENKMSLGDDSDIKNYMFSLFGSWRHSGGFFTTLVGSYTYSDYDMRSRFGSGAGDFARADYHSSTWSVGGNFGYDIQPVANLTITPTLGLYYYNTRTNRFNNGPALQGLRYRRHTLEMPVEINAKYDIEVGCDATVSLMANAGYTYNFTNKGARSNFSYDGILDSGQFIRGRRPGHSGWNVGGGAQVRYKNFDVGVHYEYYGRADYDSHSVFANVGYSF